MIPRTLEPTLFGWNEEAVSRMSLGEYGGRALAGIYGAGLERARAGKGRLVNYRELPGVVWPSLMRYWGADCPEQIPEAVARVPRFHAKNPVLAFAEDTEARNRGAPEGMRQFAALWLDGIYQQLEAQRLAQGQ